MSTDKNQEELRPESVYAIPPGQSIFIVNGILHTSGTDTMRRRVKDSTEILIKRTEQLRKLASALVVAEQKERERISHILHDDLQQILYASQMRVMLLKSEKAVSENDSLKEHIEDLESLYEEAVTVTHSLTVELSPPVLEGGGLIEAFGWLAAHMESLYDLVVTVSVYDELNFVNPDLNNLIFQVTRELLLNIVKHAETDAAHLLMAKDNGSCTVTVIDWGIGFDKAGLEELTAESSSYGFHWIRERLALFEGSLIVDSAPGKGTRVKISLPCSLVGAGPVEGR